MNPPLDTEAIRSLLITASSGEWLAADPDFPGVPRVVNQWHYTIAEVAGHGWEADVERANAALIAAAPDLLAALDALVAKCDEDHGDTMNLADARNALAKARGQVSA